MTAETAERPAEPAPAPGRNELGTISINDRVIEKMASRAAAEIPDAGAAAPRVLGRSLAAAPGGIGIRQTSLDALPRASADVDGSIVALTVTLSVRWPASVPAVTKSVRERVRDRIAELTGMRVIEVSISVTDLVTSLPAPPRVH